MTDPLFYGFVILAFLAAGIVKGAAGLGLPTTALGITTLTLDPRTAIALVLIPMCVSNIWQLYRAGAVWGALRRYAPFVITLLIGIGATVFATQSAADRTLLAALGFIMLAYVALTVSAWAPRIPDSQDTAAQIGAGVASGVMGGLAGIWAPPMALYLSARGTLKDEFVRATGLLLFVGTLPLIWGYARAGYLTPNLLGFSALLLLPTFLGFSLGERLRHRLSETQFRRLLLGLFVVMGLNLLRRAYL